MPTGTEKPPLPTTIDGLFAEFKSLEQQLDQLRRSLSHSHRLATLGTLAAMLAHEFNNLLTPIISYGQLALARPSDADLMKTAVTRSVQAAERAAKICSSLLGFAASESEAPSASLRQAAQEAITCLGRDPKKDGLALTVDLPDVEVAMPAVNLQQVLLNLVLNARKAMAPRGGSLAITGCVEGDRVRLDVADTGPGIPAAIRSRLFEPFVTHPTGADRFAAPETAEPNGTDETMERAGSGGPGGSGRSGGSGGTGRSGGSGGTGLGLSICRDLITAAGGTITFDTVADQGTTFHISVPRLAAVVEST